MPIKDMLDYIAEIVDHVEAIGNLHRLWGTTCRPLVIGCTPISGQDLNAGMTFEPTGQRGRRAIFEQLDGAAPLLIHQDGSIRSATPLTPVIDSEHAWSPHRWQRGFCDQPQQRRATCVEGVPVGQPRTRLTAQSTREVKQQRALGQCAPPAWGGQLQQSLGENDTRAASIATKETTNFDMQLHLSTAPGEIGQRPLIVTVNAARWARAERALRRAPQSRRGR
jgi:hypothetical protein